MNEAPITRAEFKDGDVRFAGERKHDLVIADTAEVETLIADKDGERPDGWRGPGGLESAAQAATVTSPTVWFNVSMGRVYVSWTSGEWSDWIPVAIVRECLAAWEAAYRR